MGGRWLLECLTRRVKDIDVAGGGDRDAGDLPHPSSFERKPHAGGRTSHRDDAGTLGALGRENDDALHAPAEPGRAGGSETGGRAGRLLLDIAAVLAGLVTAGVRFRAG